MCVIEGCENEGAGPDRLCLQCACRVWHGANKLANSKLGKLGTPRA